MTPINSTLNLALKKRPLKPIALAISLSLLSACGGGGASGDGSSGGEGGIIGTAKVPTITALTTLQAKSKSGHRLTTSIASNGKFSLSNANNEAYLIRTKPAGSARNGINDYFYGIAHSNGQSDITRNIHPFTDLIIRNWFSTKSLNINNEFDKAGGISQMPTVAEINAIESEIEGIVSKLLNDYGINGGIDLLATPFNVNGSGFDNFLNNNEVIINNNQITLIFNQNNGDTQGIGVNKLPLTTDFTASNDSPPTIPTKLRALPASSTEIVIVWEASTDDKGVAGYNIYRNGTRIATSPYPVFTDTGLSNNTNYTYEVEAIDGRAQTSNKTSPTSPLILDTADTTAPPTASGLTAVATGDDIQLNWTQSQINDVSNFLVMRGAPRNANTQIAQITSTAYTDFNLPRSSTAYCYRIISVDAAGNVSPSSNESCANVNGGGGGGGSGNTNVSFSTSNYQVNENATSITITVNRSGNMGQATSVNYAVTGGSATAGSDFTATSGTLNWAANDSSPKTFTVQISADAIAEGNETIQLQLSSPSGASLGTQTATLTITNSAVASCITLNDRDILQDTTLSEPCYKLPNGLEVNNPAKLTISPGVRLEFDAGKKLRVESGASLFAVGTAVKPIVFTAREATPGFWQGIEFYRSNSINNKLDHVTVEYGVKNIDTVSFSFDPVRMNIKNTTLRFASDLGLSIFDTSVKLDAFENITLTGNERPIDLPSSMVGKLGNDSRFTGNSDDRIHVYDQDVTTSQTWKKLDAPYFMRSTGRYDIDAAVTIEAGTTLIFNSGAQLFVDSSGSLKAEGTTSNPILFTGQEQTPGYWEGIEFYRSNSINNKLNHVTVEYGVINIDTVSFSFDPARMSIKNTILRQASDLGFKLFDKSIKLDAFENNTLTLNDRPIDIPTELVSQLGADSHYVGNTDDRIHVVDQSIETSQTWKKLDAPYFLRSTTRYDINAGLTLEAGVSLTFSSGSKFYVTSSGSLKAIGTSAEPILFTGLEKVPGYWAGIEFHRSNSANNILDHVTVEYAGLGNPSNSASIDSVCFSSDPTRFTVSNSTIKDSISWGVFQFGDESDGCFITLENNTYSNNLSGNVNTP